MEQQRFLEQWCQQLSQPDTPIEVTLKGSPGYFVAPPKWYVHHDEPIQEHLIYYIAEGSFIAEVADEPLYIGAHSVFWLLPGQLPIYRHSKDGQVEIYRFRLATAESPVDIAYFHIPNLPESRIWFEKIVAELHLENPYTRLRLRSLLTCLFSEIAIHLQSAEDRGQRRLTRHEQMKLTRRLGQQPHDQHLTPADLAHTLGFSPDYFSRIFRNTYDKSPRTWLVEQRLEIAKTYLRETDMTVAEIAAALGYNNIYFFSHQFKDYVGISPLRYRR